MWHTWSEGRGGWVRSGILVPGLVGGLRSNAAWVARYHALVVCAVLYLGCASQSQIKVESNSVSTVEYQMHESLTLRMMGLIVCIWTWF